MRKLLFLLSPLLLLADITLEELQKRPEGRVRNFQIWEYMQQDINASDAKSAYALTHKYNNKIFLKYTKKTDDKQVLNQSRCSKMNMKSLLKETNSSCVSHGLNLKTAINLNNTQRLKLASVLSKDYPTKSELILLMNNKSFVLGALKSSPQNYITLFNSLGTKNRQNYFNVVLPEERMKVLAKSKGFNKAIKYIVTDKKMHRMQKSLLCVQGGELSAQSYFFLALNALHFKATTKAMSYLEIAQKKAYYQNHKDRAVFWKFLISKNKKFLKQLSKSSDINIYTLYANEVLGLEVKNYFSSIKGLKDLPTSTNLKDPYVWEKTLKSIRTSNPKQLKELLKKYDKKEDEVLHAFIYSKMTKYKEHNYILPYKKATKNLSKDDQALLYALARQESHFIPSAISHSYALGVMQMMPFLIKELGRQKKETPELEEMFNPYKNIAYASKHIRYLQKHLYHPLFIAYAYNGGIGFTKRHLLKGSFLKGSYEPYLSMELMSNTESREYGKKVLANYIIYKKILKQELKLIPLLQKLTEPSQTDRFRMKALASSGS
ncbi:lytic transglycosylase domain-containing protein [Sulfurimonas sp. MAG313]|nr:lytic transglycosylase domain-containing protein [Sulfurimonas sp. MAG313]MDF1881401.1 lytic transglycosylase domain-containing protein [Sulfurimonas sp. MAG313]